MTSMTFQQRSETFGLEGSHPWALDVLRLVFNVPRAYAPLVSAWKDRHPGAGGALDRLVDLGFVAYQDPVIIDTRTGQPARSESRRVDRYVATAAGRRLLAAVDEDIRVFEDMFPRVADLNVKATVKLLSAFELEGTDADYGMSVLHANDRARLPERNARWWVQRFVETGLLRQLDTRFPDVREVIPAHWRPTRLLARQLAAAIDGLGAPASLKYELRLRRSRFLSDIDPARVGVSGATDYEHDITTQRVLAALLRSPATANEGVFAVEPRLSLPVDRTCSPWRFDTAAAGTLFYQPDAELREFSPSSVVRSVVEYERFQTRRDAWNHIERFLGWLHTRTRPFEGAVLRFVVDSPARQRSYTELLEAFGEYVSRFPARLPANAEITLATATVGQLLEAPDALDPFHWFQTALERGGSDTEVGPVVHNKDDSPYDDYFGRRAGARF